MKEKPDFALLIGKKGSGGSPSPDEHASDLGLSEDSDQESAENSALSDVIAAIHSKSPALLKDALKDFLELCYPDLGSHEEAEPPGEEGEY